LLIRKRFERKSMNY